MVLRPCFKREALKEEDIATIHKEYILICDDIYIYINIYIKGHIYIYNGRIYIYKSISCVTMKVVTIMENGTPYKGNRIYILYTSRWELISTCFKVALDKVLVYK